MSDAKTMRVALAALLAFAAADASAQLYKCKRPDGKVVYSDQACESSDTAGKLAPGVSNRANANEERAAAERAAAAQAEEEARRNAEALVAAQKKLGVLPASPASGAPPAAPGSATVQGSVPPGPYDLTSRDRDRLRDLQITESSVGASREQREAARMEMASIRSGREARLSAADRERRESLHADMSSADAKKRAQALRELRSLYNR
jgi:hypothetical protein